jgi:hypothetical protein
MKETILLAYISLKLMLKENKKTQLLKIQKTMINQFRLCLIFLKFNNLQLYSLHFIKS